MNLTVTQATPTITWPTPAAIVYGTPLSSTQLNATSPTAGTFAYSPAAGTVLPAGAHTLTVTFTPTDTTDYTTATATVPLTATALTLGTVSPATAQLGGGPLTVTLTGTGFVSNSSLVVNGTNLPTQYINPTTLTAVIPASLFQTVQTLSVSVADPTQAQTSAALQIVITAPPVSILFTGPSSANSAEQPPITFQLTNPYPVAITGTVTLTFQPVSGTEDDPSIQFAQGGRTMAFTIAANSTATPNIMLQTGTVAGTIKLTLTLQAGGVDVTPTTGQTIVIVLPAAVPNVSLTPSYTVNGNTVTVTVQGFSNTREVQQATFHFTTSGVPLSTPDVTVPVTAIFSGWYSTAGSINYGSSFLYNQPFTLNGDATAITGVTVTLTNSVGASEPSSTQ